MSDNREFYKVITDMYHYKAPDPLEHGYSSERDFRRALGKLSEYWKGRIGERVGQRNDHFLLRFHDTPGGRPDEAWLPVYLLQQVEPPEYMTAQDDDPPDAVEKEIDDAFGF